MFNCIYPTPFHKLPNEEKLPSKTPTGMGKKKKTFQYNVFLTTLFGALTLFENKTYTEVAPLCKLIGPKSKLYLR